MPTTPEEMRLRDVVIGSKAELAEAIYQREKTDLINAKLRHIIAMRDSELAEAIYQREKTDLINAKLRHIIAMRDSEISAIRQSHTWKIGSLVLAPLHWIKRSKR